MRKEIYLIKDTPENISSLVSFYVNVKNLPQGKNDLNLFLTDYISPELLKYSALNKFLFCTYDVYGAMLGYIAGYSYSATIPYPDFLQKNGINLLPVTVIRYIKQKFDVIKNIKNTPPYCLLLDSVVSPETEQHDVLFDLIEKSKTVAKSFGFQKIFYFVKENDTLVDFFEKMGFLLEANLIVRKKRINVMSFS